MSSQPPKSFGLLLFEGFQVLDAAGPMDCLNILAMFMEKEMKVSVIAKSLDFVTPGPADKSQPGGAFNGQQLYKPTHTFDNAPQLDVLIVPGGRGCRADLKEEVDFIRRVHDGYDEKPPAQYLFSVCTGSAIFARAGILSNVRATSNKMSWTWVTEQGKSTHWIARARWVEDGRIWTCSGVSAGIDGMVAWIARVYGEDAAQQVCNIIEHTRVKENGDDPFAELNGWFVASARLKERFAATGAVAGISMNFLLARGMCTPKPSEAEVVKNTFASVADPRISRQTNALATCHSLEHLPAGSPQSTQDRSPLLHAMWGAGGSENHTRPHAEPLPNAQARASHVRLRAVAGFLDELKAPSPIWRRCTYSKLIDTTGKTGPRATDPCLAPTTVATLLTALHAILTHARAPNPVSRDAHSQRRPPRFLSFASALGLHRKRRRPTTAPRHHPQISLLNGTHRILQSSLALECIRVDLCYVKQRGPERRGMTTE